MRPLASELAHCWSRASLSQHCGHLQNSHPQPGMDSYLFLLLWPASLGSSHHWMDLELTGSNQIDAVHTGAGFRDIQLLVQCRILCLQPVVNIADLTVAVLVTLAGVVCVAVAECRPVAAGSSSLVDSAMMHHCTSLPASVAGCVASLGSTDTPRVAGGPAPAAHPVSADATPAAQVSAL